MSAVSLLIIYLLLALIVSFTCSIVEVVLLSTPISFITMKEDEGLKGATLFKKYKTDIDRPISAILTLNTIAHTVGAAGVGAQAAVIFNNSYFGLVSTITTFLILVFSEIIPKTLGTSYWKRMTTFTAYTIRMMIFITYPLVILFENLSKLFSPKEQEVTISREEVSAMVNVGEEEGVFEQSENKIIQNLIKLDSIKAYDAMTPRVVSAIASENMTLKEFYKDSTYLHHSRIPVYADSPEFITGYILRREALEYLADDKFDVKLGDIRRDIPYFNEEASISDIWEALLEHKEQIALIIDEYGCFQGILTLEDIIETILGLEIIDEMDEVGDMQQYARERWEQRQKKYKEITLPE
jgi:CBS domain containing-hemolysin-like protein